MLHEAVILAEQVIVLSPLLLELAPLVQLLADIFFGQFCALRAYSTLKHILYNEIIDCSSNFVLRAPPG